jgi:hypothetical protein
MFGNLINDDGRYSETSLNYEELIYKSFYTKTHFPEFCIAKWYNWSGIGEGLTRPLCESIPTQGYAHARPARRPTQSVVILRRSQTRATTPRSLVATL